MWIPGKFMFHTLEFMPSSAVILNMPSLNEAVQGEFLEQYAEAMKNEIAAFIHQNTWRTLLRSEADHSLKSTRAFKLKQIPDCASIKFKSRFCVGGDLQKEGIDYFEIYALVVLWSTISILLTFVLQ